MGFYRGGLFRALVACNGAGADHWGAGRSRPQRPTGASSMKVGAHTTTGNVREVNEDRQFVDAEHGLFIVADGMGGERAGEQASTMAIEIIPRELAEVLSDESMEPGAVTEELRRACVEANSEIIGLGSIEEDFENMGTTVVIALVRGNKLYVAGLGDSRAYLIRPGSTEQLTADHSLTQALVEAGAIKPEDAKSHQFRNVLWKFLGSPEADKGPDVRTVDLQPGDRVLLASDGLTGVVSAEDLAECALRHDDPQACCEELVQKALDQGSKDNVTCIVIHPERESSDPA